MIGAAVMALLLQAATPPPAASPDLPAEQQDLVNQYLYFRAMAFHDMAAARCAAAQPELAAIEARLAAARRALVERIGAARIERLAPHDEPPPGDCRITLFGYANSVAELEHHLAAPPPPAGDKS
jgi:hypothetical protein